MLKRFASCIKVVQAFLDSKGISYPELSDKIWYKRLYFMVDIISHLITLNTNLQGKGNPAFKLFEQILAFEEKLLVIARDI